MKKVLSLVLSLCMILSLFPMTVYAADTQDPVIDVSSLTVSIPGGKSYAAVGDTVKLSVRVTDDGTIKRVFIELKNTNNNLGAKVLDMDYSSLYKRYEASFKIEEDTAQGNWSVYGIQAIDSAFHTSRLYNNNIATLTPAADLSAGDFKVGYDEPEENPPVIDPASVKVEINGGAQVAKAGDSVSVSASITDESSILAAIVYFQKPNSSDTVPCIMIHNTETDKYVGELMILSSFPAGEWSIFSIEARDSMSNTGTLYNSKNTDKTPSADLSAANFTVETENKDVYPPDIELASIKTEISSGRSVATTGDTVKFLMKITDEGEVKVATVQLVKPEDSTLSSVINLKYNEETQLYEGTMNVDGDTARGVWKIKSIMAIDNAGNSVVLHNAKASDDDVGADMSFADFTVSDDVWDPTVNIYVNGVLCTTPNEVINVEKGSSVFVAFDTAYDENIAHGYAPLVGFSDGYEGGTLSSKGFGVQTGYPAQMGYDYDKNLYGAKITSGTLEPGTTGELNYYLYLFEGDSFNYDTFDFINAKKVLVKTLHFVVADHSWNSGEVTKAPTCTAKGTKKFTCTVCGETKTEEIAAKGHTVVVDKAVAATFKAAGKTEGKHCSVCNTVITAQKSVAKLVSPTVSKLTAGKKSFTATWKKAPTVDGYQIQYATSAKFSKAKSVTVKKDKTTKTTVKKLTAKKKYFVRVRAYKTINGKKVYSAWSKVKNVTTKK